MGGGAGVIDIVGQRFGELVVERECAMVERTHAGRCREWLCRCDCGAHAIRTTNQLNQARRAGRKPCCQTCLDELRGGMREAGRRAREANGARRRAFYARLWADWHTLWSHHAETRLQDEIRDAIAEELGFRPTESVPSLPASYDPDMLFGTPVSGRGSEAEEVPEPSIVSWTRWQAAADHAVDTWAKGLPRQGAEKLLWKTFRDRRIAS